MAQKTTSADAGNRTQDAMAEQPPPGREPPPRSISRATGILSLITVLATVVTACTARSGGTPPSTVPGPASTAAALPAATTTSETAARSSTTISARLAGALVRRHDKLIMGSGHSADLDSLDRDWSTDGGQWDILVSSDYIGGYTALWVTSRNKTDYRACGDERFMLNTGDLRANDVRAGTNLCVQSDEGRLALLHVDRITTAAGRDFDSVAFTATVWEKNTP